MAIQGFITIAFDDTSLSAIKYFSQFPDELKTVITYAIEDGAEIVAQAAEEDTWTAFKNPTGNLAGNIFPEPAGPMKAEVTVDVPYAKRLEFGFHGADSLGRIYNNAPEPYAEPALVNSVDEILELVSDSIYGAFAQMGTP